MQFNMVQAYDLYNLFMKEDADLRLGIEVKRTEDDEARFWESQGKLAKRVLKQAQALVLHPLAVFTFQGHPVTNLEVSGIFINGYVEAFDARLRWFIDGRRHPLASPNPEYDLVPA